MSATWECEYCGEAVLGSVCECGRPDEKDRRIKHLEAENEGLRESKVPFLHALQNRRIKALEDALDVAVNGLEKIKRTTVNGSTHLGELAEETVAKIKELRGGGE